MLCRFYQIVREVCVVWNNSVLSSYDFNSGTAGFFENAFINKISVNKWIFVIFKYIENHKLHASRKLINYLRRWHSRGEGVRVFPSVCLCVCLFFRRVVSRKQMKLGSPNLTQKCFMMSHGNSLIFESKCHRSKSQVTTALPAWVFALLWVLPSSS